MQVTTFQKKKTPYDYLNLNNGFSTPNYSGTFGKVPTVTQPNKPQANASFENPTVIQNRLQTPVTQPKIQAPTTPKYEAPTLEDYLKKFGVDRSALDSTLQRNSTNATNRTGSYIDNSINTIDLQNKQLKEQVPLLKESFNNTKETLYKNLDIAKQGAELQKGKIQTTAGETLKTQAQRKRETDAKRMATFASLGTLDSGGAMGYTGRQENADTEFQNTQAKTEENRDQDLKSIDIQIAQAELDTKSKVDTEVVNFKKAVKDIQSAVDLNEAQKTTLITNAYYELEDKLNGYLDNYNKGVSDLEGKKLELATTMATPGKGISQSFLETGVPQTADDREYFLQNRDKSQNAGKTKDTVVSLVDQLLNANTKPITGTMQLEGLIPGTPAQRTANLYDQLKGLLSLENRTMLKGSGAISDFEAKTLERAASALGRNLSDDDFKAVLFDLKNNLGGGQNQSISNDSILKLKNAGFSDAEIQEYLGGQ